MKPRPVGAELFHVDRQTDMTKLTVASRHFVNAPKKHVSLLELIKPLIPTAYISGSVGLLVLTTSTIES